MATAQQPALPPELPAGRPVVRPGVQPLRAGEGSTFLWRKLHSLLGIIPIGAFLIEHLLSNFEASKGPAAYGEQVRFLNSLPMVRVLEWVFIFLPILYHAGYGVWIWLRGKSNIVYYPWAGNWLYVAQRYTGLIAFAYILQHVIRQRFMGVSLPEHPMAAFAKVQMELANPWMLAVYVIAMIAICWHFAYGVWLFAAKWGIIYRHAPVVVDHVVEVDLRGEPSLPVPVAQVPAQVTPCMMWPIGAGSGKHAATTSRGETFGRPPDLPRRVQAEHVKRLQHADELVPEAVLEGDPLRLDPPRHQQHLFVLHVHALDRADASREDEGLGLAERLGGEPAPAPSPRSPAGSGTPRSWSRSRRWERNRSPATRGSPRPGRRARRSR